MSPEEYARSAKRACQLSIDMSERLGNEVPESIRRTAAMSLEELADAHRKTQRERSRDVDATVEGTYGYMSGLGITREQYERMVERLHTFEYVIVKSSSLEFE
jgi:hypothetical protein